MSNEQWQEVVRSLVGAKRCLAAAWNLLDQEDGAADGVEEELAAALASIDAMYAFESAAAPNPHVATPVAVQEFWDEHRSLPGFAIGT